MANLLLNALIDSLENFEEPIIIISNSDFKKKKKDEPQSYGSLEPMPVKQSASRIPSPTPG